MILPARRPSSHGCRRAGRKRAEEELVFVSSARLIALAERAKARQPLFPTDEPDNESPQAGKQNRKHWHVWTLEGGAWRRIASFATRRQADRRAALARSNREDDTVEITRGLEKPSGRIHAESREIGGGQ